MVDKAFINMVNESAKTLSKIANELPNQLNNMKGDIPKDSIQKIEDAIKFSDLKGKLQEFQSIKNDLDKAINNL